MRERHVGLFGRTVAFVNVAAHTGRHQVFPGVATATRSGKDMIERQIITRTAAILAGVTIASKHVASRERNFFVGQANVVPQSNHGRERYVRIDESPVVFDLFGFSLNDQDDRPLPIRNVERFVGRVKD